MNAGDETALGRVPGRRNIGGRGGEVAPQIITIFHLHPPVSKAIGQARVTTWRILCRRHPVHAPAVAHDAPGAHGLCQRERPHPTPRHPRECLSGAGQSSCDADGVSMEISPSGVPARTSSIPQPRTNASALKAGGEDVIMRLVRVRPGELENPRPRASLLLFGSNPGRMFGRTSPRGAGSKDDIRPLGDGIPTMRRLLCPAIRCRPRAVRWHGSWLYDTRGRGRVRCFLGPTRSQFAGTDTGHKRARIARASPGTTGGPNQPWNHETC